MQSSIGTLSLAAIGRNVRVAATLAHMHILTSTYTRKGVRQINYIAHWLVWVGFTHSVCMCVCFRVHSYANSTYVKRTPLASGGELIASSHKCVEVCECGRVCMCVE